MGRVIREITSIEDALRIVRDLAESHTVAGVLQNTVIDRALALPPESEDSTAPRKAIKKRRRQENEGDYPAIIRVSKMAGRPKKLTAKAQEYVSTSPFTSGLC